MREVGWSVDEAADQLDLAIAQVEAATEYYDDHPELMEILRAQQAALKQSIAARVAPSETNTRGSEFDTIL